MRRRKFLMNCAGVTAAWSPTTTAAQPAKVHVILWVSTEAQPDPFIDGFREGMRARGFIEGRNLAFVLRYAPGNPEAVQAMMPELLQIPADFIFSSGPAIRAMRAATGRPVLFAISGDPVEIGLAESLARPGRNFTGATFLSLDVAQKRVQILRELLPGLRTLAILSNTTHPGEKSEHEATTQAAAALSIKIAYLPFTAGRELDSVLERLRASGADALLVYPDGVTMVNRAKIAAVARDQRLPSMFGWREYCEAGGLASYGANQRDTYVRLAAYATRLLAGEKPANLPIEQPTKFELVINARTASALGLAIPPLLMARADDVLR